MSLKKELSTLVEADVISEEVAHRIRAYYDKQSGQASMSRALMIFGVIGAVLVALGIILILAHNWDEMSRASKTLISFLPLVAGQLFCLYVLLKKPGNAGLREAGAGFTLFAIGASISLISQVYNVTGSFTMFMLTWLVLAIPLVYSMRSSFVAVMCIIGISVYTTSHTFYPSSLDPNSMYYLLLGSLMPYYLQLLRNKPESSGVAFFNWLVPLSLIIQVAEVINHEDLLVLAYVSLFGLCYVISQLPVFKNRYFLKNGYQVAGVLGTVIMLLILSFHENWDDFFGSRFTEGKDTLDEVSLAFGLTVMALLAYVVVMRKGGLKGIKPFAHMFVIFIPVWLLGYFMPGGNIIINLLVLAIGIITIWQGAEQDRLGVLNMGMLIIAALVTCRFFDTSWSFVFRGILFILVGAGFVIGNILLLKGRGQRDE